MYELVRAHALDFMARHPEQPDLGLSVARTAKYLERIADLSTNVAEMVVYMVQGVDVRHGRFER
jgi:phosphate transport system protein